MYKYLGQHKVTEDGLPVLPIELPEPESDEDDATKPIIEIRNMEMLQLLRRSQSTRRRSSLAEVIPDYTPQENLRVQQKKAFSLREVMCDGQLCLNSSGIAYDNVWFCCWADLTEGLAQNLSSAVISLPHVILLEKHQANRIFSVKLVKTTAWILTSDQNIFLLKL